eukprot:scaffold35294_cov27-Prasinocladus_malaysianus.AAC.2
MASMSSESDLAASQPACLITYNKQCVKRRSNFIILEDLSSESWRHNQAQPIPTRSAANELHQRLMILM